MRSLFVVLLLANLALFGLDRGWFGQAPGDRGRNPAKLNTQVRPDTIQIPRVPGVNAVGTPAAVAPAPAADSEAAAAPPPSPPGPADNGPPGEPATDDTADKAGPVKGDAPAVQADATAVSLPASAPQAAATPPAHAAPASCVEWGSFTDAELAVARKWSGEHLPGAAQDARREPGKPNWMVILPPAANAAAAQATAVQLTKTGMKDFFVIRDAGPLQNGISLGLFSTEPGARRRLATAQSAGLRTAKIVPRPTPSDHGWLRLQGISASDRDTLASTHVPFPHRTVRDCGEGSPPPVR